MTKRLQKGFTLIELLIVIAIIGILSSLLFVNFSGARERARDAKRKTDLQQIKSALQLYYNDFGKFPLSGTGNTIAGCGATADQICSWSSGTTAGSQFAAGNPSNIYMGLLPGDPQSPTQQYTYATDPTVDYKMTTTLENASDTDSAKSQTRCGIAPGAVVAKLYMVCNQ